MKNKQKRSDENASQPSLPLSWGAQTRDRDLFSSKEENGAEQAADSKKSSESASRVSKTSEQSDDEGYSVTHAGNEKSAKPRRYVSLSDRPPQRYSAAGNENPSSRTETASFADENQSESKEDAQSSTEKEDGTNTWEHSRFPRQESRESDYEDISESSNSYSAVEVPEFDTSLGSAMANARESYGLDVDEVSRRTRIPRDFIVNLEADHYHKLPPPVYTRSYINQLGREYGIDPDPCLRAYDEQREKSSSASPRKSMVLVLGGEGEESSTVGYAPSVTDQYLDAGNAWFNNLPRMAVMIATVLLLVLVLSAVVVQQYRNYRMRQPEADLSPPPEEVEQVEERMEDIEELVPPRQLPLRELEIPRE